MLLCDYVSHLQSGGMSRVNPASCPMCAGFRPLSGYGKRKRISYSKAGLTVSPCVYSCFVCACSHCLKAGRGFSHSLSCETLTLTSWITTESVFAHSHKLKHTKLHTHTQPYVVSLRRGNVQRSLSFRFFFQITENILLQVRLCVKGQSAVF